MSLESIARSEFLNHRLNRFIDDITLNETFSKYSGLTKLRRQNTNLFHMPLNLGMFIPPVGMLLAILYGLHYSITRESKDVNKLILDKAITSYGDRISHTAYKGGESGIVRSMENFDSSKFWKNNSIKRLIKKGRYEEALSKFYLYNRSIHISTKDDRLKFASVLLYAGRINDALNVLKGQVLNYQTLAESSSSMNLSGWDHLIDLDEKSKSIITLFSQDFSEANRANINEKDFLSQLDNSFVDPASIDSKIYRTLIKQELFKTDCSADWKYILKNLIKDHQKKVPASTAVIIYEGESFKEQIILKFGDTQMLYKDIQATEELEKLIIQYNAQNAKHIPSFLQVPGLPNANALKTYKPIGIFDIDGKSVYAIMRVPGITLLSEGEQLRSNFLHIFPLLINAISFFHNNLPKNLADSEIDSEKIHSNLLYKDDIIKILSEKGVSESLLSQFKARLEEFLVYSTRKIESHPNVTNTDSYLENWISEQFVSLVKVDNSAMRSAPPQMDLAQALDYSNFMTLKEQRRYLKEYLKLNKDRYSKKEFFDVYNHCCFYRGLRNIILAERYILNGGNPERYNYHAINCFYKSVAALRRIIREENKNEFRELEDIMFNIYHQIDDSHIKTLRSILI
jgi:hypothetical protein